jgi:hypothetical protein
MEHAFVFLFESNLPTHLSSEHSGEEEKNKKEEAVRVGDYMYTYERKTILDAMNQYVGKVEDHVENEERKKEEDQENVETVVEKQE